MINPDMFMKWLQRNLINTVIVLVFVIVAVKVHSAQQQDIATLTQQRDEEKQKNEILAQIGQSEKSLKKSARLVNNKQLDKVIDDINMKAAEAGISISQINPRPEEKLPNSIYKKYGYDLSINAPSYHAVGLFISSLEKSEALYSVDTISFRSEYQRDRNKFKVVAEMTVSTIWLVE